MYEKAVAGAVIFVHETPELVELYIGRTLFPPICNPDDAIATNLVPSDDEATQLQTFSGATLAWFQVRPESVEA